MSWSKNGPAQSQQRLICSCFQCWLAKDNQVSRYTWTNSEISHLTCGRDPSRFPLSKHWALFLLTKTPFLIMTWICPTVICHVMSLSANEFNDDNFIWLNKDLLLRRSSLQTLPLSEWISVSYANIWWMLVYFSKSELLQIWKKMKQKHLIIGNNFSFDKCYSAAVFNILLILSISYYIYADFYYSWSAAAIGWVFLGTVYFLGVKAFKELGFLFYLCK